MTRMMLTVEYDGTAYSGWQRQKNAPSVQQALEDTWYVLTKERAVFTGAGRTDAGVHAKGQVAHFDTETSIPAQKICYAMNTRLPADIRVRASQKAPEGFHATLWAKRKHYRYTIDAAVHAPAIGRQYMAHVFLPLDLEKMRRAAAAFIGEHDFAAFQAAGSQIKTTVRTVYAAEIVQQGELIFFDIIGNGFLYNMVRIAAGTLIEIGIGRLPEEAVVLALKTHCRTDAGMTAPAHGLCLMEVFYSISAENGLKREFLA